MAGSDQLWPGQSLPVDHAPFSATATWQAGHRSLHTVSFS